jgi:hypothetical protein
MCWSKEASIIGWLVSVFTGIFLLCRRNESDILLAFFILTYGLMQLSEFIIWCDQGCGVINNIGTYMAYYSLWLHVLAIGMGIYFMQKYEKVVPPNSCVCCENTPPDWKPMLIGLLVLGVGIILTPKMTCSKPDGSTNLNLVWGFDPSFYITIFAAAAILSLLYIKPVLKAVIIVFLYSVMFGFSWIYSDPNHVGSYWCFITALFSFVFIFINSQTFNNFTRSRIPKIISTFDCRHLRAFKYIKSL